MSAIHARFFRYLYDYEENISFLIKRRQNFASIEVTSTATEHARQTSRTSYHPILIRHQIVAHGYTTLETENSECCRFGIQVARSTYHENPQAANLAVILDNAAQNLVA